MAIGTAAAILGAGALGAGASALGSKRAASAVSDASAQSVAEQRRQFDLSLGLAQPGISAGNTARDQLMRLLGLAPSGGSSPLGTSSGGFSDVARRFGRGSTFQVERQNNPTGGAGTPVSTDPLEIIKNTPGFQFQTEQGTRALNANRSAGGSSGGELLKDFSRFNQGVASSFYQDYANRLQDIATGGNAAASNSGRNAIFSGANVGRSLENAGNARASGILGVTNSIGDNVNDFIQLLQEGGFKNQSFGDARIQV